MEGEGFMGYTELGGRKILHIRVCETLCCALANVQDEAQIKDVEVV